MGLTTQEVAAMARIAGIEIRNEDLVEVTYRLDLLLSKMERISHPALDEVVPLPFLPLEEASDGS